MELQEKFYVKIREEIRRSIHEELKTYRVPKEQHFRDHLFISELRDWMDQIKSTTIKTIIRTIIGTILLILFGGFIFFGKKYF